MSDTQVAESAGPEAEVRPGRAATLWPLLICAAAVVLGTVPVGAALVVLGIITINFIPLALGLPLLGIGFAVARLARRVWGWSTEAAEGLFAIYAAVAVFCLVAAFFSSGNRGLISFTPFVVFVVFAVLAVLHLRSGEVPPLPPPVPLVPMQAAEHGSHVRQTGDIALKVSHLTVEFPVGRTGLVVNAVTDVSFDVRKGETLGLVGESGCGKSTTGRAILQFPRPTSGEVWFDGHDLTDLSGEQVRSVRPKVQMIFQDPISSLNPRHTVGEIVGEPLKIWSRGTAEQREALVAETLDIVGLDPTVAMSKRPHEFSGGQCQRICVARALVLNPDLIICDEPVSALDVSVQAQILNLLEDLKGRFGLTLVFIAHDLAVVKNISDRVAVMYLGKLCEVAPPDDLYHHPAHPYTAALLGSIPVPDPTVKLDPAAALTGEIPSPVSPPSGCRFRTRCPRAEERCAVEVPMMRKVAEGHHVACHFPLEAAEPAPVSEVPVGAP
jgi:peptide/nickel transport system ATP-binding protein